MKVTFKDVSFSYDGKKTVLKDLNFVIPEGKLVCLLGPSGGGKSTTLSLISGLTTPTSGHIYFNDTDVSKKDALARKVGMVFQNYALYPHLTILQNIAFPLKMEKVPKAQREETAKKLAKLVHVDDQLNKKPGELSGGQQQRVAIARALAKKPSILLLDEPLSNLDARLRIEMRKEIRRIQQETHITTVFVTHDQEEALHIADYIMVLNQGKIQQFSTPENLYEHPANEFVAKFVGEPVINIVPINAFGHDLDGIIPSDILSKTTKVGIRSEAITPYDDKPILTRLTGKIIDNEKFGRENTTKIDYNGATLVTTEMANIEDKIGETINFNITKSGFYLFDESETTIYGEEK